MLTNIRTITVKRKKNNKNTFSKLELQSKAQVNIDKYLIYSTDVKFDNLYEPN